MAILLRTSSIDSGVLIDNAQGRTAASIPRPARSRPRLNTASHGGASEVCRMHGWRPPPTVHDTPADSRVERASTRARSPRCRCSTIIATVGPSAARV